MHATGGEQGRRWRLGRWGLGALAALLALQGTLLLHRDLGQLEQQTSPAAKQVGTGSTELRHSAASLPDLSAAGPTSAARLGAPALPKVALLFLIRGSLPLEPVWRLFLAGAAAALASPTASSGSSSGGAAGWEALFAVYAHPPPGYSYPAGSLFAGREVAGRAAVHWGQHSVVAAERALLAAALADPHTSVFAMLSDSCIPLYPAPAVYLQLVAEQRSRVNACSNESDPADATRRMVHRWQPAMAAACVTQEQWRKSSQWKSLTRQHAELVVADAAVDEVFARECWADRRPPFRRFCVSDEHYIPTLLAHHNLSAEADCGAALTHTAWRGEYFHPVTYTGGDATPAVLARLRGSGCPAWSRAAGAAAARALAAAVRRLRNQGGCGGAGAAAGLDSNQALECARGVLAEEAAAVGALVLLPAQCPLFARKVAAAASAAAVWAELLQPDLLP